MNIEQNRAVIDEIAHRWRTWDDEAVLDAYELLCDVNQADDDRAAVDDELIALIGTDAVEWIIRTVLSRIHMRQRGLVYDLANDLTDRQRARARASLDRMECRAAEHDETAAPGSELSLRHPRGQA